MIMNIHLSLVERDFATTEFPVLLTNQFTLYTQLKTNSVSEWAGIISSEKLVKMKKQIFK